MGIEPTAEIQTVLKTVALTARPSLLVVRFLHFTTYSCTPPLGRFNNNQYHMHHHFPQTISHLLQLVKSKQTHHLCNSSLAHISQ